MGSFIYLKERDVYFSNAEFRAVLTMVCDVAETRANEQEMAYIEKMRQFIKDHYAGQSLNLESHFLQLEEKKFWATMFFETAREIFDRKVGNQEKTFWQTGRIHSTYDVAMLFSEAVKIVDRDWYPDTQDYREYMEWASRLQKE